MFGMAVFHRDTFRLWYAHLHSVPLHPHYHNWIFYSTVLHLPLSDFTEDVGIEPRTKKRHIIENSKHIFPEKELSGNSPNSYIYVSVSDLYIPTIRLPILLQQNRWTDRGSI